MKRILLLLLLCVVFICAFSGEAQAVEPADAELAAQELAALGLLRGTGQGFALEEPCDRLQGAALFTRLLGAEELAFATVRSHPFKDIKADNWAAPYVGYLYNRGVAYGIASDEYGLLPMLPHQFATFCLRALDYTEGNVHSDFQWSESLDFMVNLGIISGSLRNRLAATAVFRRGDAVLLAYATLTAEVNEGGQTLVQRLQEQNVITAEQAAAFGGWPTGLRIAYPAGSLDEELLLSLGREQGLTLAVFPYDPSPLAEEEIYRQLRQEQRSFDICLLPGYIVEFLRAQELLAQIRLNDFGGEEAFIPTVRDNPYWYDQERRRYYALPLAFTLPLLYFDSERVQRPDLSWLFRANYSGSVYMPADPAKLIPLALQYYNLPYDTVEDKQLLPAIKLLSEQAPAVPAYLDRHMLDIAQWPGAVFGVISSRDLPELSRRQKENAAYANWRAIVPPAGGPMNIYYAVIAKNGATKEAAAFLQALTVPETAAAHAQLGGYLPAINGAGSFLEGAMAAIYTTQRCRPLHLDQPRRLFYEQVWRNVLLDEAQNTPQPAIARLEFSFTRLGEVYRTCRVDLAMREIITYWAGEGEKELLQTEKLKLSELQSKTVARELTRLGVALWKEYYDGPKDGPSWSLQITFADGSEKHCLGYSLPPTWPEVAGALLTQIGTDIIPGTL